MVGEEQPALSSSWEDVRIIKLMRCTSNYLLLLQASNVGIIPRALNHLFDELRMMEVEFAMRVSYLELYNEELCDLLSTDDSVKIRIFDDVTKKGSVIVQGLEEIPVKCKNDVYKLLSKGQERRKTAATLMNAQSSRSHTVFSILVHIKESNNDGEEMLKIGKLNLVDLAGSENISKAGNEKGIRTRESVNINQSLLTLGRVITALVERTPHIPYRESKLTRLLQESLGGRTKTSIIATVSPGHKDMEETLSTLDYAHRAKNIQNKPEINQRLTKKVVLKEYTEEIDRLKRDLMAAREKNGVYLASDSYNDMLYKMETQTKELNEKILLLKALKDDLASKSKLFEEASHSLDVVSKALTKTRCEKDIIEGTLKTTKKKLRMVERDVDEKSHLLVCHQKTEQALTEHATELIEVADEASGDTKGLHASIDRRKDVEMKAVTESERLIGNLTDNALDIKSEIERMTIKHKDSINMIIHDVDASSNVSKQFTSSMLKSMKSLMDFRENFRCEVLKSIAEWKDQTYNTVDGDFNQLLHKVTEMENRQEAFISQISCKIDVMTEILAKEKSESVEMRSQLMQKIDCQNAEINSFCDGLKTKIEQNCKQLEKLSNERKRKSDAQKEKILEIKKLIKEVEDVAMECEPIDAEFNQLKDNLMEVDDVDIKQFNNKHSTLLSEKMLVVRKIQDAQDEMHKKINENLQETRTVAIDYDEHIKSELGQQSDLTTSGINNVKENLNVMQVTMNEKFQKGSVHEMDATQSINSTVANEGTRVSVFNQQTKSVVQKGLHNLIKSTETEIVEKIQKCSEEIEQFKNLDVLTYKSSGETPARKDYKFNRTLVATSPHQKIIKRLRMERGAEWDASEIINEVSVLFK